jgi:hypothetical protein
MKASNLIGAVNTEIILDAELTSGLKELGPLLLFYPLFTCSPHFSAFTYLYTIDIYAHYQRMSAVRTKACLAYIYLRKSSLKTSS